MFNLINFEKIMMKSFEFIGKTVSLSCGQYIFYVSFAVVIQLKNAKRYLIHDQKENLAKL